MIFTWTHSVVKVFHILTDLSSLPDAIKSGFFKKSTFVTSLRCPTYILCAMLSSVDHNFIVLSADPLKKK